MGVVLGLCGASPEGLMLPNVEAPPLLPPEGALSLVWTPEVVAKWGGEDRWLGVVWGEVGDKEEAEEEAVQGPEPCPT